MLFPTFDFAIFFCVVYVGAWLINRRNALWKLWILAASYYFYAYWDWRFTFLLLASTVIAQGAAELIAHTTSPRLRRAEMVGGVVALLGLLGYFKYYGFFSQNLDNALSHVRLGNLVLVVLLVVVGIAGPVTALQLRTRSVRLGFGVATVVTMLAIVLAFVGSDYFGLNHSTLSAPLLNPTLPIAISFFTFMAVSYVVDVYRGTLPVGKPLDVAVYLSFFPHLVSGPIVRGSELLPQLRRPRDPHAIDMPRASALIMGGLFKKVVVSAYVSSAIVTPVFQSPGAHSAPEVLFAVWAYAIQIYADFSGYTDIAIGIALLLGIRFPVNFDAPYTARSLQDFWRRWHITLSRWLRDYLYIPLGGNRGSMAVTCRNIMLTMVLGGLWHGANWTFLAWGAIHGVGQVVGHVKRSVRAKMGLAPESDWWPAVLFQRVFTFQYVALGWLFFNATSMSNAYALLGRLGSGWGAPSPLVTPLLVLTLVAAIGSQYVPPRAVDRAIAAFGRATAPVQAAALGLGLLATTTLAPTGVQPFIYYKF